MKEVMGGSVIVWIGGDKVYRHLGKLFAGLSSRRRHYVAYDREYWRNCMSGIFVMHGGRTVDITEDVFAAYDNGQPIPRNREAQERLRNLFRAEFPGFPLGKNDSDALWDNLQGQGALGAQ